MTTELDEPATWPELVEQAANPDLINAPCPACGAGHGDLC